EDDGAREQHDEHTDDCGCDRGERFGDGLACATRIDGAGFGHQGLRNWSSALDGGKRSVGGRHDRPASRTKANEYVREYGPRRRTVQGDAKWIDTVTTPNATRRRKPDAHSSAREALLD